MRVSMRFRFRIGAVILALAMSALSLGATSPVSAEDAKRYVLLGTNSILPANLEYQIAAVGGKLVERIDEIGVAIVESADPAFVYAAESISGVQAVAKNRVVALAPVPTDESVALEGAGDGVAVEGHNPSLARFFAAQWALSAIDANDAWTAGYRGNPAVRVAVIDTGIDYTHQELAGKVDMLRSRSFFTEALSPLPPVASPACPTCRSPNAPIHPFLDFNGHGTHVAAIIAGTGFSVAGVAPHVTLIAVKVAGRLGFADLGTIAGAIVYAATPVALGGAGADVINMSFGAIVDEDEEVEAAGDQEELLELLERAVKFARRSGAFLVASAGNQHINWDRMEDDFIKVPAQLDHVAGVSATGQWFGANPDESTPYTDFGKSIVDFAAPGGNLTTFRCLPIFASGRMAACNPVEPSHPLYRMAMPADAILSACSRFIWLGGSLLASRFPCRSGLANIFMVGTSMSAGYVSGVAALVDASGGGLQGEQIMQILRRTADDFGKSGRDALYGFGRVNALRAAACAALMATSGKKEPEHCSGR